MSQFARALLAGYLYSEERRSYTGFGGQRYTVTLMIPPTDEVLDAHIWDLIYAFDARYAAHNDTYRIGIKINTDTYSKLVIPDITRPAETVRKFYDVVTYRPMIVAEGEKPVNGTWFMDAADLGISPKDIFLYRVILERMRMIEFQLPPIGDRDSKYWAILNKKKWELEARFMKPHLTWIRRRHAMAAFRP